MMVKRLYILIAAALIVVALAGCGQPYSYHGMPLESPKPAADFTLDSSRGGPVSLSDLRGKVVPIYFGYTFCPDVCPTTLSTMNKALELMGDKAKDVQFVMVTVDPQRDRPEVLRQYLANFNASFIGLTGTPEQISAVATPFGIYYQQHEGSAATGYLVDHTASLTVLDKQGRTRLLIPFDAPAEDIAEDLEHLLRE